MYFARYFTNLIKAANAGNLIRSSKTDQKRALLKLILTNSTIIDKKAWISLKKTVRFTSKIKRLHILVGAAPPRYTIIKIYKNSWGQKLHFYDFSNCVFSYSPCAMLWRIQLPLDKTKMPSWGIFILSWLGQLDSNQH